MVLNHFFVLFSLRRLASWSELVMAVTNRSDFESIHRFLPCTKEKLFWMSWRQRTRYPHGRNFVVWFVWHLFRLVVVLTTIVVVICMIQDCGLKEYEQNPSSRNWQYCQCKAKTPSSGQTWRYAVIWSNFHPVNYPQTRTMCNYIKSPPNFHLWLSDSCVSLTLITERYRLSIRGCATTSSSQHPVPHPWYLRSKTNHQPQGDPVRASQWHHLWAG